MRGERETHKLALPLSLSPHSSIRYISLRVARKENHFPPIFAHHPYIPPLPSPNMRPPQPNPHNSVICLCGLSELIEPSSIENACLSPQAGRQAPFCARSSQSLATEFAPVFVDSGAAQADQTGRPRTDRPTLFAEIAGSNRKRPQSLQFAAPPASACNVHKDSGGPPGRLFAVDNAVGVGDDDSADDEIIDTI